MCRETDDIDAQTIAQILGADGLTVLTEDGDEVRDGADDLAAGLGTGIVRESGIQIFVLERNQHVPVTCRGWLVRRSRGRRGGRLEFLVGQGGDEHAAHGVPASDMAANIDNLASEEKFASTLCEYSVDVAHLSFAGQVDGAAEIPGLRDGIRDAVGFDGRAGKRARRDGATQAELNGGCAEEFLEADRVIRILEDKSISGGLSTGLGGEDMPLRC